MRLRGAKSTQVLKEAQSSARQHLGLVLLDLLDPPFGDAVEENLHGKEDQRGQNPGKELVESKLHVVLMVTTGFSATGPSGHRQR